MGTDKKQKNETPRRTNRRRRSSTPDAPVRDWTVANPALTRPEKPKFAKFRETLVAELDPQSMTERILAEQIATHRWQILECDAAEAASMRNAVRNFRTPPWTVADAFSPGFARLRCKLIEANIPADPDERHDLYQTQAFNAPEIEKIHQCRKEHERALDRAQKEWRQLARDRASSEP